MSFERRTRSYRPGWSMPHVVVRVLLTLVMCASLGVQQAISINSDQEQAQQQPSQPKPPSTASKSEIPSLNITAIGSIAATAADAQVMTTKSTASVPAAANAILMKKSQLFAGGTTQTSTITRAQQSSGRGARQRPSTTTTRSPPSGPTEGLDYAHDPIHEELRRVMAEYRNTPPVFVTSTRDFFVDVARYPLGFKLTTIQALDSEGDHIEYSLKPANYRDASPYFTINSTTGELRLANRRFPSLQAQITSSVYQDELNQTRQFMSSPSLEPSPDAPEEEDRDMDDELLADADATGARQAGVVRTSDAAVQSNERSSFLYFLNVAASDGHYTSVVELQIHVFNSTSFGTKAPVQLTIEGGRRSGEFMMRAKANEFFERLYSPTGARAHGLSGTSSSNSTLVLPSFVNPNLIASTGGLLAAPVASPSTNTDSEDLLAANTTLAAAIDSHLQTGDQANTNALISSPHQQPIAQAPENASRLQPYQHQEAMQQLHPQHQPIMLSLVIVICSFFTMALVLLIFVVPISVKRLKKRLKKMELQHEQMSQKTSPSGASSIICSSASTSGPSSIVNTHPSSLSQFTLSSSTGSHSCAMLQMAADSPGGATSTTNAQHVLTTGPTILGGFRAPLGRQSSLDSAITSANFAPQSISTHSHLRYEPHLLLRQRNVALSNNGPNNCSSNAAIMNPAYLNQYQHQSQAIGLVQRFTSERVSNEPSYKDNYRNNNNNSISDNIYCPIDDEFYSTINTDLEQPNASTCSNIAAVGSLVGRTFESRNYFAAQCAPHVNDQAAHSHAFAVGLSHEFRRDNDTPNSTSSRSSTRSLARFLSLPACQWAQKAQLHQPWADGQTGERKKRSHLAELEYHFGGGSGSGDGAIATLRPQASRKQLATVGGAQTIARTTHIGLEQQVRRGLSVNGDRDRDKDGDGEHEWELERHRLKFLDILDEGQFGLVWRCKLRELATAKSGERIVAVKTLKSSAAKDEREREELLAEIEIMKRVCGHPNVVRILHCCTRDIGQSRPILLVMEHVEMGKLQSFLESSRTSHVTSPTAAGICSISSRPHNCGKPGECSEDDLDRGLTSSLVSYQCGTIKTSGHEQLTSRELIKFIYHVAKGMEYIASQCIVHRDLASRNVLISGQRVCKIGDFGMARHMASRGDVYERHSRNAKIPVRWMAPEVLLENSFTSKSDVYSFGILMWEIVTLGSTPYRHLKTNQIVEAVAQRGERPSRPDYCHPLLYNIMSSCWSASAHLRPSFSELVAQLDELLTSSDEYIQLNQYSDHNYYNIPQTAAPLELL